MTTNEIFSIYIKNAYTMWDENDMYGHVLFNDDIYEWTGKENKCIRSVLMFVDKHGNYGIVDAVIDKINFKQDPKFRGALYLTTVQGNLFSNKAKRKSNG